MTIPAALSRSERHPNGLRLLGCEILERVALHRLLHDDHQPEQAFGLLPHRLRIARALVTRHGRGIDPDLRGKSALDNPRYFRRNRISFGKSRSRFSASASAMDLCSSASDGISA